MTGEQLHNLFPVLYQKAGHDALEAGPHKGDWFYFSRSGYTGSQKYAPMVWSGDPEASFDDALGLPAMVRAGTNMGWSGVAHWGSDIGGFKCSSAGYAGADAEMLTRWIEQGALTSNMQDQDACPAAKDQGVKASIWNAPEAMSAWKTYARLHTRLFPYLYTLAHEATTSGAPTMRHPFFERPIPEFARVDDLYFFGPSLLVAPVVRRGARTRDIVLPKDSTWVDWSAPVPVRLEGPGPLTLDAPLSRLPLLLRDGYLIPMLDPTIDTLSDESHPEVVGPTDVATVYDVVGLVSLRSGAAHFVVHDGSRFDVSYSGQVAAPANGTLEELGSGLRRLRVSVEAGASAVSAGGLRLLAESKRRTRWDIYVAD
jgi:alpha-glucosidase (family GH31 glycosyl hydrolase)